MMHRPSLVISSSDPTGAPSCADTACTKTYTPQARGFSSANTDIHVVRDQDWDDGDPIPQDISGTVETASVVNGDVRQVLIWHAPLVPGEYDIVIDANRNRVYDASTDGLDRGSSGFVVIPDIPPSPVPAIAPSGIVVLIGLMCTIGGSRIRGKFN